MSLPTLSVVIPALNEEAHLPLVLADLKAQKDISLEILVGDGGSIDGSGRIARAAGAGVVQAPRGRGVQMNRAAAEAVGEYLFFVHADSRIEDPLLLSRAVGALTGKIEALGHGDVAGHFALRFHRTTQNHEMAFRFLEEKTAFNRANTTNGDQGFLLRRDFFHRLNGFDERLPFLEDQQLAEKIRAQGVWITLPGVLHTSARRFESEGFHRRYILMSMIMGLHTAGVDSFFAHAPQAYQVQEKTGRLLLSPFFRLVRRIMRQELGFAGSIRLWYQVGRLVRRNSWMLFYFFDVWARPLLGRGRYPFLAFHDRVFGPLTDFRIFNAITAVGSFVWFMGVLAAYFRLRDSGRAADVRKG